MTESCDQKSGKRTFDPNTAGDDVPSDGAMYAQHSRSLLTQEQNDAIDREMDYRIALVVAEEDAARRIVLALRTRALSVEHHRSTVEVTAQRHVANVTWRRS